MKDKIYNSKFDMELALEIWTNDYSFDVETQTYIPA